MSGQLIKADQSPTEVAPYETLYPMAQRLDELYQQVLDKIEEQVISASDINSSINELLQNHGEDAVLKWNPDLAISPRSAYQSFADALARSAAPLLGMNSLRSSFRFLDLIDWTDAPVQAGRDYREFQLDKVRYARGKRVTRFLDDLMVRYKPESRPRQAVTQATSEFAGIFSVTTPMGTVIPISKESGPTTLRYRFFRKDSDLLWHIAPRHHNATLRAANAIATIGILSNIPAAAHSISDMLNAFESQLAKNMMRYESGEVFHAGSFMRITLTRDAIEFALGETIFRAMRKEIEAHISDIRFIWH